MKKSILIVWTSTFVVALIILSNPLEHFILYGATFLGWLLFALQVTYRKSDRFYIFIRRQWFRLKNPECVWNINMMLNLDNIDLNIFEKIEEKTQNHFNELKVTNISNVRRLYQVGTVTYEIYIDVNNNKLVANINKLEVSYRRSVNLIDNQVGKFLDVIKNITHYKDGDFGATIEFSEFNPYYGLFLERLDAKDIKNFSVTINTSDNKVAVNDNSIILHANDLWELNTISKKYLSLSPH